MASNNFRDSMLASLQQTVLGDLLPDLGSSRNREFAKCTGRLLARLRTDFETAPMLAASRVDDWRQIANQSGIGAASATITDPLEAFKMETAHVAEAIKQKRADTVFMRDLSDESSDATAWLKQVVAATSDYIDAYECAVPKIAGKSDSPATDPELLRQKLTQYLAARYPQLPSDPVVSFKIIPGGRSKETSLFELVANEVMPSRLVLRRDLNQTTTGTSVFGEYALLKEMAALGLPVPQPIAAEKNPVHLGGGFIIVAEVVDSDRAGDLFPELNDLTRFDASFGPDLARALARLHSLSKYPAGVDLGGHHAAADPIDMVRNFQTLWDGITNKPPMSVATELGFAFLLSHPLPADRPRRLVHGDVGFHNMMMRDGRLAAILDWELTHIGDPAEDIGYIRAPILKPLMPWEQFVAAYVAEGGEKTACDLEAVNWYSVWAHTRNSVYVALMYDFACKGQMTDIDTFFPAIDFTARTQHYIARELELALNLD